MNILNKQKHFFIFPSRKINFLTIFFYLPRPLLGIQVKLNIFYLSSLKIKNIIHMEGQLGAFTCTIGMLLFIGEQYKFKYRVSHET